MDNLIYHYCSQSAFLNIVKSKVLWATDLSKVNDPHEVEPGKAIIEKLFSEYFPDSELLDNQPIFEGGDELFFSCSMSKNGDLLSQWRSYAVDGSGFSLGFDPDILLRNNLSPFISGSTVEIGGIRGVPEFLIDSVIYDESSYIEKIRLEMEAYKSEYGIPFDKNKKHPRDVFLNELLFDSHLLKLSCLYKSAYYKEEQEVRIFKSVSRSRLPISNTPFDMKLRSVDFIDSTYGIKAYIPISLTSNDNYKPALQQVILGPKNNSNKKDIDLYLKIHGFIDIEVEKSKGFYR